MYDRLSADRSVKPLRPAGPKQPSRASHLQQCPTRPSFLSWHAPRGSTTVPRPPASRPSSSCAEREPNTFFVFLGAGSAQAIVTSPDNAPAGTLSDALINDPGSTAARHAPASSYHGKTRSMAQSSARGFDGWEAHLTSEPSISRVVQHECFNDESGREPRECRWLEVPKDVTGRKLKAFRKSPCPPCASKLPHDSDDDALG